MIKKGKLLNQFGNMRRTRMTWLEIAKHARKIPETLN